MPRATAAELDDRYGDVVAKYNSTRTPENVYDVRRKGEALSCNCPGWRFRKSCRHVDRQRLGLDDDAAVAERIARATTLLDTLVAARCSFNDYQVVGIKEAIGIVASGGKQRNNLRACGESVLRLLAALDDSGLFAPRAVKPDVVRSRGARLITLDDD